MKRLVLLIAILMAFVSCGTSENRPNQDAVRQIILAKERQALDRWAAGDPAGFAVNFASDVTYFDDIAAQTRVDGIEAMREYLTSLAGKIESHTYEIVDHKVQVYDDIAISTLHYQPSRDGKPGNPWKATDVYQLTNGEWRLVHAHWSLVKSQ